MPCVTHDRHQVIAYVRRPDQFERLATLGLKPTTKITSLFDCGSSSPCCRMTLPSVKSRPGVMTAGHSWSRSRIRARRRSSFHEHNKHPRRI